jgi:hypothetical protein
MADVLGPGLSTINVCCGECQIWPVCAGRNQHLGVHARIIKVAQQVWPAHRSRCGAVSAAATVLAKVACCCKLQSSCCHKVLLPVCSRAGTIDASCAECPVNIAFAAGAGSLWFCAMKLVVPVHRAGAAPVTCVDTIERSMSEFACLYLSNSRNSLAATVIRCCSLRKNGY